MKINSILPLQLNVNTHIKSFMIDVAETLIILYGVFMSDHIFYTSTAAYSTRHGHLDNL